MNAHTPGPWKVVARCTMIQAPRRSTQFMHDIDVARIEYGPELYAGELEANARLIAAAPDLLEALRDVLEMVTWIGSGEKAYQIDVDEVLRKASAALAKAGVS